MAGYFRHGSYGRRHCLPISGDIMKPDMTKCLDHGDNVVCPYCENRATPQTAPNPVELEIAYRNALYIRDNVLHQTAQARAAESVAALARFEPKLEARYGR